MRQQYDSYKPSGIDWIGDIPSHWNIAPIKNSFRLFAGATPKTERSEYWEGDIVWITPADYKTDDHYINEGRKNITKEGLASCATEIVPKGSLIFSKRAPIGTVALANTPMCTNQGCISCAPKSKTISNYFYYLCRIATSEFEILGSGATFLEISSTNFANFKMPLPPLAEQEDIAAWLDEKCGEIEAAIAKVDREIELIDELKQSEISRVVTRGLNPDAPMRPSGIDWIGDIPAHWKVAPIKNSFILYAGATPKTERAEFWDGDIVWITPADYKTDDHFVKEGRKNITLEGLASCATEIVPIDSLIFSKRAPIGTVAIASIPLCTNQGCISCVPKSISHSNYFYYLCRIATSEFEILGSGATFLEISSSNFANFKMPLPPLSEQVAIADYLDAKCAEIDGLKAKLSKKRETLTELRQSIISEVVTGKRKAI